MCFATKRTPRALSPGLNLLHSLCQSEEDEKLKKRKERFGIVTSSAGAGATEDTEVKAQEADGSRGDPSAAIGLPLNRCPVSPTAVSTAASFRACMDQICALPFLVLRSSLSWLPLNLLLPFGRCGGSKSPQTPSRHEGCGADPVSSFPPSPPLDASVLCVSDPSFKSVTSSGHSCPFSSVFVPWIRPTLGAHCAAPGSMQGRCSCGAPNCIHGTHLRTKGPFGLGRAAR